MHHHQHTSTVGHQDHGAGNRLQLVLDRLDTRRQVELVLLQGRYRTDVFQLGCQQRLPMIRHVITQARNDQNRGFTHRHIHFRIPHPMVRQFLEPLGRTVGFALWRCFTFCVSHFTFGDSAW
ncbi:hypothetical protein D3C87_1871010 [compost metagenome]